MPPRASSEQAGASFPTSSEQMPQLFQELSASPNFLGLSSMSSKVPNLIYEQCK